MLRTIRIISLGEGITPNLTKGLKAFAAIIAQKKAVKAESIVGDVQSVVVANQLAIDQFKQGTLKEEAFDQLFIDALDKKTGIKLTVDEFNQAWAAMNPEYKDYASFLDQAAKYNSAKNQQMVFISYTNPKDMRLLLAYLRSNNQEYKIDTEGNLTEIKGVKVYLTYQMEKTKAEVIELVIKDLKKKPQSAEAKVGLFESAELDIKYIYGVNKIRFESLRKDFETTTQAVKEAAATFSVETILWDKESHKTLQDILAVERPTCGLLAVAKL